MIPLCCGSETEVVYEIQVKRREPVKRFYSACIALLLLVTSATPVVMAQAQNALRVPFTEVQGLAMIDEEDTVMV